MKFSILHTFIIFISLVSLTKGYTQDIPLKIEITASNDTITSNSEYFIKVKITNSSNQSIYLVKDLENSYNWMRYPRMNFIETVRNDTMCRDLYSGCGMFADIDTSDFVKLAPNESFNPFVNSILLCYYFEPGINKIKFRYNTFENDIQKWRGTMNVQCYENPDCNKIIIERFNQVPKVILESNQITVFFKK